jgi:hypothetical protein
MWDGASQPAARTYAPDSSGDPQDVDRDRLVQPFRDLAHAIEGIGLQKLETALVEAMIAAGFIAKKAGGAVFGVFTSPEPAGAGEEAELWRQSDERRRVRADAAAKLAALLTLYRDAFFSEWRVVMQDVWRADP